MNEVNVDVNWRERFKPSNPQEAGCYRLVFIIVAIPVIIILLLFLIRLLASLYVPDLLIWALLLLGGLAWLIHMVRADLAVSIPSAYSKSSWFRLLVDGIRLALFALLFLGTRWFAESFLPLPPNQWIDGIFIFGSFLIFLVLIGWLKQPLETLLLRYLVDRSTDNDEDK